MSFVRDFGFCVSGGIAQCFREPVFADKMTQVWIPAPKLLLTTAYNFTYWGSDVIFWPPRAPGTCRKLTYIHRDKKHMHLPDSGIIILGVAENCFSIYSISSVFSLVLQCIVGPGDFCMFLCNIDESVLGFLKSLWGKKKPGVLMPIILWAIGSKIWVAICFDSSGTWSMTGGWFLRSKTRAATKSVT